MKKTPDAILCADFHFRADNPECRKDIFLQTLSRKMKFLKKLQEHCNMAPFLFAGDLFHKWNNKPALLSWAIEQMPHYFYGVPGNHDLPAHNLDRYSESSMGVVQMARKVSYLHGPKVRQKIMSFHSKSVPFCAIGFPYGSKPEKPPKKFEKMRKVAVIHEYCYKGKKPFPGAMNGVTKMMRKFPDYDLIVTGDNHIPFVHEMEGRLLVNPGSLTRQTADQIDHKPRVYLWFADDNRVEKLYLPIKKWHVSREHLDKTKERDEKIKIFVDRLDKNFETQISFDANMKKMVKGVNDKKVRRKIEEAWHGN